MTGSLCRSLCCSCQSQLSQGWFVSVPCCYVSVEVESDRVRCLCAGAAAAPARPWDQLAAPGHGCSISSGADRNCSTHVCCPSHGRRPGSNSPRCARGPSSNGPGGSSSGSHPSASCLCPSSHPSSTACQCGGSSQFSHRSGRGRHCAGSWSPGCSCGKPSCSCRPKQQ